MGLRIVLGRNARFVDALWAYIMTRGKDVQKNYKVVLERDGVTCIVRKMGSIKEITCTTALVLSGCLITKHSYGFEAEYQYYALSIDKDGVMSAKLIDSSSIEATYLDSDGSGVFDHNALTDLPAFMNSYWIGPDGKIGSMWEGAGAGLHTHSNDTTYAAGAFFYSSLGADKYNLNEVCPYSSWYYRKNKAAYETVMQKYEGSSLLSKRSVTTETGYTYIVYQRFKHSNLVTKYIEEWVDEEGMDQTYEQTLFEITFSEDEGFFDGIARTRNALRTFATTSDGTTSYFWVDYGVSAGQSEVEAVSDPYHRRWYSFDHESRTLVKQPRIAAGGAGAFEMVFFTTTDKGKTFTPHSDQDIVSVNKYLQATSTYGNAWLLWNASAARLELYVDGVIQYSFEEGFTVYGGLVDRNFGEDFAVAGWRRPPPTYVIQLDLVVVWIHKNSDGTYSGVMLDDTTITNDLTNDNPTVDSFFSGISFMYPRNVFQRNYR